MLVQIVSFDRCYGGPEEGGWWYDRETVLFEANPPKRIAKKLAKRLAVEVCEAYPSAEIELFRPRQGECRNHGECPKCRNLAVVIQTAYRGRNRYSVIGGADIQIRLGAHRIETMRHRPHYE